MEFCLFGIDIVSDDRLTALTLELINLGIDVRELAVAGVEIIAPTFEISAPLGMETEVVCEKLTVPTVEIQGIHVREPAGQDVEITTPPLSSLHRLGLRLRL